jgi:hypothetical protein
MILPPPPEPEPGPELAARALADAPTVLESFFWGWLSGDQEAERLYFEELVTIRDLQGPSNEPEDFA